MKASTVAGVGIMVAAAGGAAWWLLSQGGNTFDASVSEVFNRANVVGSTKSRAQVLQELRAAEAATKSDLEAARSQVEAEYRRKLAGATFGGSTVKQRVETACSGIWCFANPYCGCDDQVLSEYQAEVEQWHADALASRVYPLEAELETIKSEVDAVYMTA